MLHNSVRAALVPTHLTASNAQVRPLFPIKDLKWQLTATEMRRPLFWASASIFPILYHSVYQHPGGSTCPVIVSADIGTSGLAGHITHDGRRSMPFSASPSTDGCMRHMLTWSSFQKRRTLMHVYWATRRDRPAVLAKTADYFRAKSHSALHSGRVCKGSDTWLR